jgi:hypothetical protein
LLISHSEYRIGKRRFKPAPRAAACALAFAAGCGLTRRAEAQPVETTPDEPASFGSSGQFVLSVDRLAGVMVTTQRMNQRETDASPSVPVCSGTIVTGSFFGSPTGVPGSCATSAFGSFVWGGDVFVARGISLGGTVAVSSGSSDESIAGQAASVHAFTLSPRVGYVHALSSKWAIWPRVGIGWGSATTDIDQEDPGSPNFPSGHYSMSNHRVTANVDLKFVFSPISHAALFGGPFVTVPISDSFRSEGPGGANEGSFSTFGVGLAGGVLLYL